MAKKVIISGLLAGVTATATRPPGDTWLTLLLSGNELTVSVSQYAGTDASRTSAVTVTGSDGSTASLPVTQNKKSGIVLSPPSLAFDSAGNWLDGEPVEEDPETPTEEQDEPTEAPTQAPTETPTDD
ncbi:MAG: hypothetical protein LBK22_04320 [Tannerella sp.]|jgi:hypothetical protein|nr:hypothetical protein [Tannerella sp.]